MTGKTIFSRFMNTKEKDGIVAVFNSLNPKPIFVNKEDWNNFLKGKTEQDILNLLSSLKLIINDGRDDDVAIKNIQEKYEIDNKQISILYLVLTHRCNFRCKYCFEVSFDDEKSHGVMMSNEIAKDGINLLVEHLETTISDDKRCLIILYGGEPLLNKDTCFYSVEYIRSLQKQNILPKEKTEIVIITNGSLINEKTATFFKNNNVAVIVSVDSLKEEINDYCRIDKSGKGTFKKTIKAIEILKKTGVDLGVSVTITPYNVDELDTIPEWLSELEIKNYGLNRLVGSTYDMIRSQMPEEEYSNKANRQIIKCFINARELGIYEDRMGRKIIRSLAKNFIQPTAELTGNSL